MLRTLAFTTGLALCCSLGWTSAASAQTPLAKLGQLGLSIKNGKLMLPHPIKINLFGVQYEKDGFDLWKPTISAICSVVKPCREHFDPRKKHPDELP
jgi:hypothetical protein